MLEINFWNSLCTKYIQIVFKRERKIFKWLLKCFFMLAVSENVPKDKFEQKSSQWIHPRQKKSGIKGINFFNFITIAVSSLSLSRLNGCVGDSEDKFPFDELFPKLTTTFFLHNAKIVRYCRQINHTIFSIKSHSRHATYASEEISPISKVRAKANWKNEIISLKVEVVNFKW